VDFNVYLPPNWSPDNPIKYPLIILLHGQGENESSFPNAISVDSLNYWINQNILPELVLISLRGGEDTNEMQWYSSANIKMITRQGEGELRSYCNKLFNTTMKNSQISLIGHSRGATGALNFALRFPNSFASVISSAFVSDYALDRLKKAANSNLEEIVKSNIKIKMLIGTEDQFVLKMKREGSYILSDFFKEKGIKHDFEILQGKRHNLHEIWDPINSKTYLKFCAKSWDLNSN